MFHKYFSLLGAYVKKTNSNVDPPIGGEQHALWVICMLPRGP